MDEAYVRLHCPGCAKQWESTPTALPKHHTTFDCPDCQESRRLAEFTRTEYDLNTLKNLS